MAEMILAQSLEDIEDAIVAALQADAVIAAYAKSVVPFQGTLADAAREVALRDPAFIVLFGGAAGETQALGDQLDQQWMVVVRTRNLRSNKAGRGGATGEVGSYQMVQDALRVLSRSDLSLDGVGPLRIREVELVQAGQVKDRAVSMYQLVFAQLVDLVPAPATNDFDGASGTLEVRNDRTDTWKEVVEVEV